MTNATELDVPGLTSDYVAVAGVRFHIRRGGPARKRRTTPTLLLHGVPETSACWRDLAPELVRDRIVLAPDLKGLGSSEPSGPYDIPTLVSELAALVLHEIDGPVDVVGHDWGGTLALALAAARPDLVRRVVDVSGLYRRVNLLTAWHIPTFAVPLLPEAAFRVAGRDLVRLMVRATWRAETPMAADLLDHYVAAYASPARIEAMLGYYRASVRSRLSRAITARSGRPAENGQDDVPPRKEITAERALVVWGAADPVTRLADGEAVVRDVGAQASMLSLPGVGHWPLQEAPDVVVPAIAEFLRAP